MAELRKKRMRIGIRVGGVVAVIAVVVVIITPGERERHGQGAAPAEEPARAGPGRPVVHVVDVGQPPAATPGPETIPVPSGPKLASLINASTGQTIDNVQCQAGEQTEVHVHTHLTIFVNGKAQVIPYGIGIPGFQAVQTAEGPFVETGSCFYPGSTCTANDGIIHVECTHTSMSFTLGQFFDEWGQPLSTSQVGPATGKVTVFFTAPGQKTGIYTGDPRNLPLGDHYQIQLDVGTPIVAPVQITNWGQL